VSPSPCPSVTFPVSILGVRERSDKLVRELVLSDPAPFVPLVVAKRDKDVDYEAKTVVLAGRRYIVCRNLDEMKKDAAARAAILETLEKQLKKVDKAFVSNKGYRRYLAPPQGDGFAIDRAKAEEDAKFDGVFELRTNTKLSPLEAMMCYKRLWMVERVFPTSKSVFETRPIFHKLDETIRGYVACSFLALVFEEGAGGPHRRSRRGGLMAGHSRRSRLIDGDGSRTGWQALSVACGATSRRQLRAARRRRRPAAHRAPNPPRLTPRKPQNVVPSRSLGTVFCVISITCKIEL